MDSSGPSKVHKRVLSLQGYSDEAARKKKRRIVKGEIISTRGNTTTKTKTKTTIHSSSSGSIRETSKPTKPLAEDRYSTGRIRRKEVDTIEGQSEKAKMKLEQMRDAAFTFGEGDILDSTAHNFDIPAVSTGHIEVEVDVPDSEANVASGSQKKPKINLPPIFKFLHYRAQLLQEMMRREGPVGVGHQCQGCKRGTFDATYRCQRCNESKTFCKECMISSHTRTPLHLVELWNGFCWTRTTLKDLGLVINLGHQNHLCPYYTDSVNANASHTLTVLDVDGMQKVSVRYCECEQRRGLEWQHRYQLMRNLWYPASFSNPRTVATFAMLDLFQTLTMQGKISGYDFYKSLVARTDNAGTTDVTRRYEEFMSMARQYQHLKMLQRAGFGSRTDKIDSMGVGELTVECPACPHPSCNLPENWEDDEDDWKYSHYLMMDANFKQKRRARKTKDDPDLAGGGAYFVENEKYKEYLDSYEDEQEANHCTSGLRAVEQANLRGGRGYDVTGIIALQCRHMFYLGGGVADLQRGERYRNSDYILMNVLSRSKLKWIVLSYDIACQYGKNLRKRVSNYPEELQMSPSITALEMVIPMFHIIGHGDDCQTRFSLSFRPHMGRTDGENIERGWAAFNPASMQLREMGQGSRKDLFNSHLGYWNWQRVVVIGTILYNRLREAKKEAQRLKDAHIAFSEGFPEEEQDKISDKITKWNKDPENNEDPYSENSGKGKNGVPPRKGKGKATMDSTNGGDIKQRGSSSQWIRMGLKLEEEKLEAKKRYDSLKLDSTSAKYTAAEDYNREVLQKIQFWRSKAGLYLRRMPDELNEEMDLEDTEGELVLAWEVDLHLPSNLEPDIRSTICETNLMEEEFIIRQAEARDALDNVRRLLLEERAQRLQKQRYASGSQTITTRSLGTIGTIEDMRNKQVERYRTMRAAMERLDPNGTWKSQLKVLLNEHLKAPFRDVYNTGRESNPKSNPKEKSQGRHAPTWIWGIAGLLDIGDELENTGKEHEGLSAALRVEWAKSKARMERWTEEVVLVKEEMRRVLTYLEWRAMKWLKEVSDIDTTGLETEIGAIAYANKQAMVLRAMAEKFKAMWAPIVDNFNLPQFGELPLIRVHQAGSVHQA